MMNNITDLLVELKVPYDYKVLTTDTPELRLVNNYFESVSCGDKGIEQLLWEMIGYCLTTTTKLAKAFVLYGTGRNGKSVCLRLIEKMLGDDKVSHEPLEKLFGSKAGAKTTVEKLKGCCVNIIEDQRNVKHLDMAMLLKLISGEPISIGKKDDVKKDFTSYAKLLFTVNETIDFKEVGTFITNRIIVIPFNAYFNDNDRNIHIVEQLCEDLPLQIIATKAIQSFSKVLENGKFTIPPSVEQATIDYFLENNNVAEFCNLFPIKTFVSKEKYYNLYKQWCTSNNKDAVNNSIFGKRVFALGYREERPSFGGKRKFYYVAPDFKKSQCRDAYNEYISKCGISQATAEAYDEEHLMSTFGTKSFDDYLCESLYNDIDNRE